MKAFPFVCLALLGSACALAGSDAIRETIDSAQALERKGDALGARALLRQAANASPDNSAAALAYARFLDAYHDPDTRQAYRNALSLLRSEQREERQSALRRLVLLDLIAGDRAAAAQRLDADRAAGGNLWPAGLPAEKPSEPPKTIEIPGPLRSFERMAALTPDLAPDQLLPALARNVVTHGYQAAGELLEPTEYLKLLEHYLSQARELAQLAGPKKAIRIEQCDSAETGDLLRILGYRMRGGCGADVVLETVNASRAFLTIDSGFPISQLEQALRANHKFEYEYGPYAVPIRYAADYWTPGGEKSAPFIDTFLGDPILCRAYLGFDKLDRATADALRAAAPLDRIKAFAPVLDFFGGMFEARGGQAVVPGGERTASMWAELVGVPPSRGGEFYAKLISRDDGWMASYFDALSRVSGPVEQYFTEPQRLKRFYLAIRGRVTSPGPARPIFQANTDMMLLTARLRLDADGRAHIPGGVEVWKSLFSRHTFINLDARLVRAAPAWKEPDDVIEALFGLCRKMGDNAPLAVFMELSDVDRRRSQPLDAATVQRLGADYHDYGAQYSLFAESPELSGRTMVQYLDAAHAINKLGDTQQVADLAGSLQALAGLWQILCRQGSIPPGAADATLAGIIAPFASARGNRELFDAGRAGVRLLLSAAGEPDKASPQERMLDLLTGTAASQDETTHAQMIQQMVRIFEAQRLASLDSLFELADNLDAAARGEKIDLALVKRLAARIAEIRSPWASSTADERGAMLLASTVERHIENERRLNLNVAIQRAQGSPEHLRDLRGALGPLLRDTLVGLNYVHYAPPGAQVLLANPAFVRSHDFLGSSSGRPLTWQSANVASGGWPTSAGGRITGSLSGLPYALALAEQNFMVPVREQALIWGDLAPQLILSATIPRWWNVTPAQLHWVQLHLRFAESLVAESVLDADVRREAIAALEEHATPGRASQVADLLANGQVRAALDDITPCELFAMARELAASHPASAFAGDIARLEREDPAHINYQAISLAFGTPKPTLTGSYGPELLYVRTFPALMGYSSRILAESWESDSLYWAALADELHTPPSQLNVLIPEWTQQSVERVFATHLEDWPALLRSIRSVGEDIRTKARMRTDTEQKASLE